MEMLYIRKICSITIEGTWPPPPHTPRGENIAGRAWGGVGGKKGLNRDSLTSI